MRYGYFGKLLRVDLTTQTTSVIEIDDADVRRFLLGSGLAAKLLYYGTDHGLDPLDPRSPLIFMAGLFTGGPLVATSKLSVCAKSPLTGIWNEATVGGHWPAEFRRTGYDGIVFEGRAKAPVYLHLTDESIAFQSAAKLWGHHTYDVEGSLRPKIGKKAKIACIGPAGENGVLFSSVVFDPPISRVAARAGVGAVMGSKNLKAVVVEGNPKVKVAIADPKGLKAHIREDSEPIRRDTKGLYNYGTSGGVTVVHSFGDLPIKNWQLGEWQEGAEAITGQTIQPKYLDKHYACYTCSIRCGKIYKVKHRDLHGHGPEYESLGMLGANVLVDEPEAVIEANEWCNRYGMDTISTGTSVAFAIEAFERGLLTERDTGGAKLAWDGETLLHLVHEIGNARGIGKLLGRGVKQVAEVLGGDADQFAVHTKGLEYPAHDPRGHVSMALNYATAARGACHLEALTFFLDRGIQVPDFGYLKRPNPHDSSDKPPIVVNMQNYMSVFNPLGMCKFLLIGGVGPKMTSEWLNLYCGYDFDMDSLLLTGERIFNLKRLYNTRLGIRSKDDKLPPRLAEQAKPDGPAKGVLPDMQTMLGAYYELRGWTEDGIPTKAKLAELSLDVDTGADAQSSAGSTARG